MNLTESDKKQIRVLLKAQAQIHARKAARRRAQDTKHAIPESQTVARVMREVGPNPDQIQPHGGQSVNIHYVAAFDIKKADAIVACPACSCEITADREDITSGDWVVFCPRCGAAFGVVPLERYRKYVDASWHQGPPNGAPAYCDFVVRTVNPDRGSVTETRWHGWVDPDTRKVVQVG